MIFWFCLRHQNKPREPSLKNAQAKDITGTTQYHIFMNL